MRTRGQGGPLTQGVAAADTIRPRRLVVAPADELAADGGDGRFDQNDEIQVAVAAKPTTKRRARPSPPCAAPSPRLRLRKAGRRSSDGNPPALPKHQAQHHAVIGKGATRYQDLKEQHVGQRHPTKPRGRRLKNASRCFHRFCSTPNDQRNLCLKNMARVSGASVRAIASPA